VHDRDERKKVGLMSPSPNALSISEAGDGWLMIGIMVRLIRFQSLFKVDRNHRLNIQEPLRGIVGADTEIKVVLEGTLMRLAMGVFAILGQFLGFGIVSGSAAFAMRGAKVSNTAHRKGVTEIIHAAFLGVFSHRIFVM